MRHSTYLILEVVWALPIIVIQWAIGLDILLRRWKVLLPGIIVPAVYLTLADAFALSVPIWTVNPDLSLNVVLPFNVPIEELVFFLLTNTMIVQGLILVLTPRTGGRLHWLWILLRRGPELLKEQKSKPAPRKSARG